MRILTKVCPCGVSYRVGTKHECRVKAAKGGHGSTVPDTRAQPNPSRL